MKGIVMMLQRWLLLFGLLLTVPFLTVGQITDDPSDPGYVYTFQFSADGKSIAGYTGVSLFFWDLESRKLLRRLEAKAEYATFVQPGQLLSLVPGDDGSHIIDVAANRELKFLEGADLDNNANLAFSDDGKTLAYADRGEISLWDLTTGKEKPALKRVNQDPDNSGPREDFTKPLFSPDGQSLASLGRSLILWSMSTGKQSRSIEINAGLLHMSFTPDGKMICVSGFDNIKPAFIKCFAVSTGREALSVPANASAPFAISPDGKVLALSRPGHGIFLISMATGKEIGQITMSVKEGSGSTHYLNEHSYTKMSFSPNGKLLALASADGLLLLDAVARKQLFILGERVR